jgi:hypothetical protein
MILSENRYPLFGIVHLAMLGAQRRGDAARQRRLCNRSAIYAKALMQASVMQAVMMQASMVQTDDAGLDGYRNLDLKGCAEGA